MSLSDCPDCWDTPCICKTGHLGSKVHAFKQLEEKVAVLEKNKPAVFVNSMQQLLDLGLNAFAFELMCESYIRTLDLIKIPEDKAVIEVRLKGVVLTLRKEEV